ncbi:hypothetical protein U27_03021 [Candidatus Vecturithrix granuli]|uniref:Radical SAM core domain-containing protein n=1 Tax=Vecturithrix granuli TaxID=1499967 RepID=A0A081BUQ4_VECG1|nr:hypothetical protein U27_03021 [Candidatus Vecturithrix granuli]
MDPLIAFHLAVELTNRCNFSCIHCFRENNITENPDIPVEVYEKFLKESLSYKSPYITLTGGGEPTLHQDFEAILALTARYHYAYTLITNGWTFETVYPLLDRFRTNLHTVVLSLDGATEETHDAIRQQPGSYRKVIQACMICYYKQIPFQLTMTVHRLNFSEIDEFLVLASKLGATEVNLGPAQLTKKLVSKGLALSPQERKQLHAKNLSLEENPLLPVNIGFDYFIENPCVPCYTLRMSSLLLDYDGHVRFCCQLSGYEDHAETGGLDMIEDLRQSSVWECHRALVRKITTFQEEKIRRIEQQTFTENEHFPCYYCAKYFHKLDWLKDFPDSEWSGDDD